MDHESRDKFGGLRSIRSSVSVKGKTKVVGEGIRAGRKGSQGAWAHCERRSGGRAPRNAETEK